MVRFSDVTDREMATKDAEIAALEQERDRLALELKQAGIWSNQSAGAEARMKDERDRLAKESHFLTGVNIRLKNLLVSVGVGASPLEPSVTIEEAIQRLIQERDQARAEVKRLDDELVKVLVHRDAVIRRAEAAEQKVAEFEKEKEMILREDAEDKKDLDRTVASQAKTIEALREYYEASEAILTARVVGLRASPAQADRLEKARAALKEVGKE